MKTLDRQKLDVTNKTRSNIFGWRGKFTSEFVAYLLDEANEGTGLVVDPICGGDAASLERTSRSRYTFPARSRKSGWLGSVKSNMPWLNFERMPWPTVRRRSALPTRRTN